MSSASQAVPAAAPQARAGTLATIVHGHLRRDIVRRVIPPGEKLRVENLAAHYGVGATPVREALNRLVAEGLVTQQDQRGFRATPISRDELLELTRTRAWVAEIVLRESIAHGDDAWEEGILLAFRRLSRTPARLPGDAQEINPAWEVQHHAFHAALIAACPSRQLLDFSARLFESADRYRSLTVHADVGQARDVQAEHRALMEATMERRTADAVRLLNEHTQRTTDLVLGYLDAARESREPREARG